MAPRVIFVDTNMVEEKESNRVLRNIHRVKKLLSACFYYKLILYKNSGRDSNN